MSVSSPDYNGCFMNYGLYMELQNAPARTYPEEFSYFGSDNLAQIPPFSDYMSVDYSTPVKDLKSRYGDCQNIFTAEQDKNLLTEFKSNNKMACKDFSFASKITPFNDVLNCLSSQRNSFQLIDLYKFTQTTKPKKTVNQKTKNPKKVRKAVSAGLREAQKTQKTTANSRCSKKRSKKDHTTRKNSNDSKIE